MSLADDVRIVPRHAVPFDNAVYLVAGGRVVAVIHNLERGPMALSSFCALQRARVEDRLEQLEERLKRNDLLGEHRAGKLRRYLANWQAVERRFH